MEPLILQYPVGTLVFLQTVFAFALKTTPILLTIGLYLLYCYWNVGDVESVLLEEIDPHYQVIVNFINSIPVISTLYHFLPDVSTLLPSPLDMKDLVEFSDMVAYRNERNVTAQVSPGIKYLLNSTLHLIPGNKASLYAPFDLEGLYYTTLHTLTFDTEKQASKQSSRK